MRAICIVFFQPRPEDDFRFFQSVNDLTVQSFITELVMKALLVGLLPWRACFDAVSVDPLLCKMFLERGSNELRTVITSYINWTSVLQYKLIKVFNDIRWPVAASWVKSEALSRILVDHPQDPHALPVGRLVCWHAAV